MLSCSCCCWAIGNWVLLLEKRSRIRESKKICVSMEFRIFRSPFHRMPYIQFQARLLSQQQRMVREPHLFLYCLRRRSTKRLGTSQIFHTSRQKKKIVAFQNTIFLSAFKLGIKGNSVMMECACVRLFNVCLCFCVYVCVCAFVS